MAQEDGGTPDRVTGLATAEAVDAVLARGDASDPAGVRATLERVTEDGVVTAAAVDSALADASQVVSTAETRTELAAIALSDAREAAAPVADFDAVESRLDGFASRLEAVQAHRDAAGADLQALVERRDDSAGVYEVASELREITAHASEVQQTADALQMDVDAFEEWVETPRVRSRELGEDVDAIEEALDELAGTVDGIADAREDGIERSADGRASDAEDVGAAWFDATLRHRVVGLLSDDVRAELADLRAWADREDRAGDRADEVGGRLDDLDARHAAIGDELDGLARPAWSNRFDDRLAAFETALDGFEPPVVWDDVEATLDERRPSLFAGP